MKTNLKPINTRFRAYKLSSAGACFSYCADKTFILIEARLPDNKDLIKNEMYFMDVKCLSNLHITSWDQDHCSYNDLEWILKELKPLKVEVPGYDPHTLSAKECSNLIEEYKREMTKKVIYMTPEYINSLDKADSYDYKNVVFHPKKITEKSNDNSTIKFFRIGMFNVLSLGDVESEKIGAMLKNSSLIKEVDVMILPHHGGNSELLTKDLLEKIDPKIAICASNYGNQYDHPKQEIRNILSSLKIELYTTKCNDVIIESQNSHYGAYRVFDYCVEDEAEKNVKARLKPKKFIKLNKHQDNLKPKMKPNIK